jgi:curved DNA-binding protein CbpA
MNTSGTYYDLLGVSTDASEEEIQEAYRELVRETHPDINDEPNAREQMVELSKARDVLTDTQKRAEYNAEQNIAGGDTQETTHTTTGSESVSSQSQYHDTDSTTHQRTHQSTGHSTTQNGRQTTGTGTHSSAREQTRSRRERDRRSRTHTCTGTRDRTSQTTSESGSIGTVSPRIYIKNLYYQRGRLLRRGCQEAVVILFNICTLGLVGFWSRERVRSYLISPTSLRLAAAFGLWWVVSYGVRQVNGNTVSGENGVLLIGLCLFGSYLGHDLLKEYTGLIGDPLSERYDSKANIQFWLVIGANLLALGLVFWGMRTVPFGGVTFAFGAVVFFLAALVFSGIMIMVILFAIGANVSETILGYSFILGPVLGLFTTLGYLFTPIYTSKKEGFLTGMAADLSASLSLPVTAHPWISSQLIGQVGPVYAGVFINAVIGGLMLGSWFWSLLTVWRLLTKAPWNDRFGHRYRIRPGFWNFLVMLPFAIFAGMEVYDINLMSFSLGVIAISFTIDNVILLFGVLPILLAGFYMVRRQVEPWIQEIL